MLKCLNVKMKDEGFSLLEMLITVFIFSIIISATIGLFVSAIRLQKYNLVRQQLLDQTSYAMEYMERAIRMAQKDEIGCIDGSNYYEGTGNRIEFATYHNQCWKFFLSDGQLKIDKANGSPYNLTSEDFIVNSLNVEVSGDITGEDPNLQPRVTIFMEIEGEGLISPPKIRIQTTVSQRNLDM